jgi:hypothetical protein
MKHGLNNIIEIETFYPDSLTKGVTKINCKNDCEDIIVIDDGKNVNEFPMKSLLRNYIAGVAAMSKSNAASGDWIEYDGTTETTSDPAFLRATGPAGTVTRGPMVGTDDGTIYPLAIDNYHLGALIGHGTGAGQLSYGATTVNSPTVSGIYYSVDITRQFTNSSGGDITIEELALANYWWYPYGATYYGILSRDVGIGHIVTNGGSSTVTIKHLITETSGITKNYIKWMYGMFTDNTSVQLIDTGGAIETMESYPNMGNAGYYSAGNVSSVYGLVVGTDDTAADWDDYALKSQINAGTSAGQLWHTGGTTSSINTSGNTASFFVQRGFFNFSGSPITIRETGLYGYQDGTNPIMMFRYPISPGVTLLDNEGMVIKIYFTVTV